MDNYIRFDWAMKRLLRNKANYAVIEGLLESLLGRKYTIERFLESESNQETGEDKFNRVDILAESDKGELTIIEIQNNRELTYFHRMLYGVSKAITDYIDLGNDYDKVRKVYSINIVYFELGQGKDYVYHGKTFFCGWNPNRVFNVTAFVGGGANIAWGNDEANEIGAHIKDLDKYNLLYLWDGTKVRPFGRAGLDLEFKVSKSVSIMLEGNAEYRVELITKS